MNVYNYISHIVHRLNYYLFSVLQAVIDIIIYQICFSFFPVNLTLELRIFLTGTMSACFIFNKLYGFRNLSLWDETTFILRACVLMLLLNVLYLYANKFTVAFWSVVMGTIMFIPIVLLARYFYRRILFTFGLLSKSIIIFGAGKNGGIFAHNIINSTFTIRKIAGFLDDDEAKQGKIIEGVPVLGKLKDFEHLQKDLNVDEAVIAIPSASRKNLADILNKLEQNVSRVLYIPDMYMLTTSTASIRNMDGLPVITSSQGLLNPVNLAIKTFIDYIGAVIALIIFSPVMLWAAWRIKQEDGGPIFFNQDRVGWKAKHFTTYKFRTMYTNADEITRKLFSDPKILAAYKEGIKMKHDPRVTKIGAFLRKTSIDELPQLFNVLKGEMSLVGPRPLMQSDVDIVYSGYVVKKVYAAKPGLTGIWQVSGRSDLDADFRREINCYYVHNWSIWLDIAILLKTPLAVITSKGAY